ncbi:ankyrin repeat domain-containing protein 50-like [Physella acuta]|uniref:ankyrin repeat domain-containing protein 50-like n=1 Tax=Physella acuta TaxID=109671 RepID=UPI0027DBBBAF|nr:ankyrin repeat domain-containing protein 50-like [Physella acuta]
MGTLEKTPALVAAAQSGDLPLVEKLLRAGHPVDAGDEHGATALHWACCRGHEAICRLLLDAGCDVDARIKWGGTALLSAVDNGHEGCVRLLLNRGVNVDVPNARGDTPLHMAAYRGYHKLLCLLTDAGANPFHRNSHSLTPIQEAYARRHTDCVSHLQEYTSKVKDKFQNPPQKPTSEIISKNFNSLSDDVIRLARPPKKLDGSFSNLTPEPKLSNLHQHNSLPADVSLDSDYSSYSSGQGSYPDTNVGGKYSTWQDSSFESLFYKATPVNAQYGCPVSKRVHEVCGNNIKDTRLNAEQTRSNASDSKDSSKLHIIAPPELPPRPSWLVDKTTVGYQIQGSEKMSEKQAKLASDKENIGTEEDKKGETILKLQSKMAELQQQLDMCQSFNIQLKHQIVRLMNENIALKADNANLQRSRQHEPKLLNISPHGVSELDEGVHSAPYLSSYPPSSYPPSSYPPTSAGVAPSYLGGYRSREPVESNEML